MDSSPTQQQRAVARYADIPGLRLVCADAVGHLRYVKPYSHGSPRYGRSARMARDAAPGGSGRRPEVRAAQQQHGATRRRDGNARRRTAAGRRRGDTPADGLLLSALPGRLSELLLGVEADGDPLSSRSW